MTYVLKLNTLLLIIPVEILRSLHSDFISLHQSDLRVGKWT